jgi:hypothetical protein
MSALLLQIVGLQHMNSRPFQESDLPEISEWFADLEWPLPPTEEILPKVGCVVESKGRLLACGWLYTTDSSLAFLSWLACNPNIEGPLGDAALQKLVEDVQKVVETNTKIRTVMILTRSKDFAVKLKHLGFKRKTGMELCTWIVKE